MITLNYTISEQEFKDLFYFMGWQSPARRSHRARYFISIIIFYLVLVFLLFYLRNIRFDLPAIVIPLVVLPALLAYLTFSVKRQYYRLGMKIFNESGNNPIEVTISETGVYSKTKDGEAHYKWSAFAKKFEANNCYYLVLSSYLAIIIPQRVFRLQKDQEAFEKMLSQYLPLHAALPEVNN